MNGHTAPAANSSRVPEFHWPFAHAIVVTMPTTIAIASTDAAIRRCYPVMRQLRPHLDEARYMELTTDMVRSAQFTLAYVEETGVVTAVAGYRYMTMLYSNGKVLYVDDLVTGMIRMMTNDRDFVGPVNLGNPREFTILELAKLTLKLIPESRSRIVYKELPADDPRQRKPDITLARDILDWAPVTELEDGLRRTIAYFRELIADPERFRG